LEENKNLGRENRILFAHGNDGSTAMCETFALAAAMLLDSRQSLQIQYIMYNSLKGQHSRGGEILLESLRNPAGFV